MNDCLPINEQHIDDDEYGIVEVDEDYEYDSWVDRNLD